MRSIRRYAVITSLLMFSFNGYADEPAQVASPMLLISNNVPIGTLVAYAGPVLSTLEKNGWLLCDGRALNRTLSKYINLFNAIGYSWGGDGADNFNIPDLRGIFLRGVDGDAGQDPEKSTRTSIRPGGNSGNTVGSVQSDAFTSHSHAASITDGKPFSSAPIADSDFKTGMAGGTAFNDWGASGISRSNSRVAISISPTGKGLETRPKNAGVNWIIKYK